MLIVWLSPWMRCRVEMVAKATLSDLILKNHNRSPRQVRPDYMDHLAVKTREFERIYYGGDDPASCFTRDTDRPPDQRAMVDRIFALLEPYAHELCRMSGPGALSVTAHAPAESREIIAEDWPHRPPQAVCFYRCRFATSAFSASIRGLEGQVKFFLMPVEQAIRLNDAEEEFGCLMTFEDTSNGWTVEGKDLSDNRLERYSLLFFNHFVDRTRQELLSRRR